MAPVKRPDSNEEIGKRLRLIRLAYGHLQGVPKMSKAEVGRRIGVERQAWQNAEAGYYRIGLDMAMDVARKLGASLDYIYFGNRAALPHALAVEIERLEGAEVNPSRVMRRA